jgi:hypothetical protein
MGVDVSRLNPSPQQLRKGVTVVDISYYGIVDNPNDNPVSLELHIEPLSPLFFVENGTRTKVLTGTKTLSATAPELCVWQTHIEVTQKPAVPKACALRLEATDAHGYKSKTTSFVIYY